MTSTTGGRSVGGVDNPRLAQIFTPTAGGALPEVRVGVNCTSTQLITGQILGTMGGRPDESVVLASTAVSVSPRTTFTRFQFDGAPTLSAGTEYALVLRGPTASGCYAFMAEDTYPGKVYWDDESANTPTGWTENAAPEDIGFATFRTAAGRPSSSRTRTTAGPARSGRRSWTPTRTKGAETITFAIPGSGRHTITLATALPAIAENTTIDGASQSGFIGTPLIELTGGSSFAGLALTGHDSVVRSLALYGFQNAVEITGTRNRLVGNYIGLDGTGTARGNANIGVIVGVGEDNEIGGAAAGDRNVISNSGGNGIVVSTATDTTIRNNLIGVNADGNAAMPNALNGILMNPGSSGTSIVDNVVSGNIHDGVFVHSQATLLGNRIGLAATSEKAIPNHDDGVQLNGDGSDVGADGAASANTIANNGLDGVFVSGGPTNEIIANSIYSNGGLGIDLGPLNGVTPNDVEDGDSGPNDLQNFPEFESVTFATGSTDHLHIVASSPVPPPTGSYRIDYYANSVCDASGNGEGARHLGHDLTTSDGGRVSFDSDSVGPVLPGEIVTATLTSPIGSTSEFSECQEIGGDVSELLFTTPADCVPGAIGGHTTNFEDAPAEGSLAAFYAPLGVQLVDDAKTTPIASRNADRTTSSPTASLLNHPDGIEAGSNDIPLTMLFDEPQTRVGFFAGNGAAGVTAQLTAYGGSNEPVGSVRVAVPATAVSTYIGLRLPEGTFTKLTLDYGGSARAEEIDDLCFLTKEGGGESTVISLTTDQANVVAGVKLVPLGDVPSNQLPSFAGAPSSTPVGSIPVGSIPVGSIPVGSIPVGSIPVGSIPVGSIPVGSIPVGSIPVGSIGLNAIPVGSIGLDQILLSMLPVTGRRAARRHATLHAAAVSRSRSATSTRTRPRVRGSTRSTSPESGLMHSILGGVPFAAFLLGRATLSQLPPPGGASSWCAAITAAGGSCSGVSGTNTVVGLSIASVPVGSIPVGSIPVGSIPVGSIPVGSIPVGSIDLAASRLAAIPLGSIPAERGTRSSTHHSPPAGRSGMQRQRGGSSRERS